MLEALFATIAVVSSIGASWLVAARRRERGQLWVATAEGAQLSAIALQKSFLGGPTLTGWSGPLRVRVESHTRDREHEDARVEVDNPENPLRGVTLRREDAATEFSKLFGTREIETGDSSFDDTFFIGGTPALVYGFLDAETRSLIGRLNIEGGFEIRSGRFRLDIRENDEGWLLPTVLDRLLVLARRLGYRADTAVRLATNALSDPRPRVRLHNLLCLIREFGEHPIIAETLRAACADRDPEVRLRAATALGPEGSETLLGMTKDLGLADVWQASAVAALGRRLPFESAKEVLGYALRGRRFETARACIGVIGSCGLAAVEPLVEALRVNKGIVAADAARALGTLGAPSAEAPLIRALGREAPGLRVAAAEALGRSGTVAAVLPLKRTAELSHDTELRRAARQAVAEIQSRLPGASPGQLSLSSSEAGRLSLAQAEAGQLSFPPGEQGQLSLAEREGDHSVNSRSRENG